MVLLLLYSFTGSTNHQELSLPRLNLDNTPILYIHKVRYLGILQDFKLNWTPQIEAKITMAQNRPSFSQKCHGQTIGPQPCSCQLTLRGHNQTLTLLQMSALGACPENQKYSPKIKQITNDLPWCPCLQFALKPPLLARNNIQHSPYL